MPIKIAIAGIGNCASSLVQGIHYYSIPDNGDRGLQHPQIGPYRVGDLQVVAAFHIDTRKVNRPLEEALFPAPKNNKRVVSSIPRTGRTVQMGPIPPWVPGHIEEEPPH